MRSSPAIASLLVLSLSSTLVPVVAHADDKADAMALFDQGIADLKANKLDDACRELRASLDKYTDSGTKGALATCETQRGKTASAWQLWRDLADTAPNPKMRADAAARAAKLEPQVPKFVVKLTGAAPAGLVVTVNGRTVDPSLGVPLPIDPGAIDASAAAPDYEPWKGTAQATAGQVTTIEVPELTAKPKPIEPVGPTGPTGPTTSPDTHATPAFHLVESSHARHSRHVLAVVVGATGVALIGGGFIFGGAASSQWDKAQDACGGDVSHCPAANLETAQSHYDDADKAATMSTIFVIAGGAALATGVVLWLTAPGTTMERVDGPGGMTLAPTVAPDMVGLSLSGRM